MCVAGSMLLFSWGLGTWVEQSKHDLSLPLFLSAYSGAFLSCSLELLS